MPYHSLRVTRRLISKPLILLNYSIFILVSNGFLFLLTVRIILVLHPSDSSYHWRIGIRQCQWHPTCYRSSSEETLERQIRPSRILGHPSNQRKFYHCHCLNLYINWFLFKNAHTFLLVEMLRFKCIHWLGTQHTKLMLWTKCHWMRCFG